MTKEQEEIARAVQNLMRMHPLLLVGSGFSCGYGLPGMGELGSHLLSTVEAWLGPDALRLWQEAASAIATNLEDGLHRIPSGAPGRPEIIAALREETAQFIISRTRNAEVAILSRADHGCAAPVRLLKRLYAGAPQNSGCVPIITTNYDTLIELFCDLAELPLDTGFAGFRRRRPRSGSLFQTQYNRVTTARKGGAFYEHRVCPSVRVMKPHGSITWHIDQLGPIEVLNVDVEKSPAIVVPGPSKYEDALTNQLFDNIRTEMNLAVQKAGALFCIGVSPNWKPPVSSRNRSLDLLINISLKDFCFAAGAYSAAFE